MPPPAPGMSGNMNLWEDTSQARPPGGQLERPASLTPWPSFTRGATSRCPTRHPRSQIEDSPIYSPAAYNPRGNLLLLVRLPFSRKYSGT